jgi:hypothetical protein
MPGRTWAIGNDIEIHCRFCRVNQEGQVAAVMDNEVIKVQCRSCRHFQDYKPAIPEQARRQKLLKKAMIIAGRRTGVNVSNEAIAEEVKETPKTDAEISAEALALRLWQEATKNATPMKCKVYDKTRTYRMEDLVAHKAMGLGVVREVRDEDDTILILFKDGYKRLEHSRPDDD